MSRVPALGAVYPEVVSIKALLRGHPFDLESLAELFPAPSDPNVVEGTDGHYLTFESATVDLEQDPTLIFDEANSLLRAVMGSARILNVNIQSVELAGRFTDDNGQVHVLLLVDSAMSRSSASMVKLTVNGETVPTPPPIAPRYIDLASRHPDVLDVLNFLGKAGSLDWFDLYKVFEVVRDYVFQTNGGKRGAKWALIDTGWITEDELNSFTGSANHPLASGEAARHARQGGKAPNKVLSLGEGRDLILRLAQTWLDSLT